MTHETSAACAYTTDRLVVGEWGRLADEYALDLVDVVNVILTSAMTADLPSDWQGGYDHDRAVRWIAARDAESPTLLVVDRRTRQACGLVILFDAPSEQYPGRVEVRLGYVLAESAQGRGLATEVVAGLVDWAQADQRVVTLAGGVAEGNAASARVLAKNGFESRRAENGQLVFELSVR